MIAQWFLLIEVKLFLNHSEVSWTIGWGFNVSNLAFLKYIWQLISIPYDFFETRCYNSVNMLTNSTSYKLGSSLELVSNTRIVLLPKSHIWRIKLSITYGNFLFVSICNLTKFYWILDTLAKFTKFWLQKVKIFDDFSIRIIIKRWLIESTQVTILWKKRKQEKFVFWNLTFEQKSLKIEKNSCQLLDHKKTIVNGKFSQVFSSCLVWLY